MFNTFWRGRVTFSREEPAIFSPSLCRINPIIEQPDSWRLFTKLRSARDAERNLDARAQTFLKRIAPLSADLAAHGRTRALALKKLRRICQAAVRHLKANYSPATVKFYLFKYRDSIRAVEPDHLVLRPRKMRSGQRFSYLALEPEETRALNAAYRHAERKIGRYDPCPCGSGKKYKQCCGKPAL